MTKTIAYKRRALAARRNLAIVPYNNTAVPRKLRMRSRASARVPLRSTLGYGYNAPMVSRIPRNYGIPNLSAAERSILTNDGAYSVSKIKVPMAGGAIMRRQRMTPGIVTKDGSTIIANTEFGAEVNALGGVNVIRYPFLPTGVQWLSAIALNYSKWRAVAIRYIYIPVCPTTTPGTVTMALGYDYNDTLPTSLAQLSVSFESISTPPWGGYEGTSLLNQHFAPETGGAVIVDVDCDRFGSGSGLTYYPVTAQTTFAGQTPTDQNQFSPFYLQVATSGNALAWGNLYVQYCIEFIEPVLAARNL
jgi:hypothetical protein